VVGLLDRIGTPSPRTESRTNGVILLMSCLLCVPGMTIWRQSVVFLVFVSLWTMVRNDMGVWLTSRAKAKQEQERKDRD
jgi:hypothetical protein